MKGVQVCIVLYKHTTTGIVRNSLVPMQILSKTSSKEGRKVRVNPRLSGVCTVLRVWELSEKVT